MLPTIMIIIHCARVRVRAILASAQSAAQAAPSRRCRLLRAEGHVMLCSARVPVCEGAVCERERSWTTFGMPAAAPRLSRVQWHARWCSPVRGGANPPRSRGCRDGARCRATRRSASSGARSTLRPGPHPTSRSTKLKP